MGHLLKFKVGPTDKAKSRISTTINTESADEYLISRGAFYDRFFIRAFRKAKVPTPQSSTPHSPLLSDRLWRNCMSSFRVVHPTIKRRRKACVWPWSELNEELESSTPPSGLGSWQLSMRLVRHDGQKVIPRCAHIFSESTYVGIDSDPVKEDYCECMDYHQTFWILQELKGENIHRLENILTLEYNLRDHFDDLTLWLEPTGVDNRYKVCTTEERYILDPWKLPHFVEFTSTRSDLSLPSKEYLDIHAACCRVAHMSGAVEYLNLLEDDDPLKSKIRSYGSDFGDVLAA